MNLAVKPVLAGGQMATVPSKTGEEIRSLLLASRAAKLGSRPPVIAALAEISQSKARAIYRDVTGTDPIKGQMPSDISFYISNVNCHFESVWLAQAFKSLTHPDDDHFKQCECLFTVYEQYLKHFTSPEISFDRFFLLIRNMFYGNQISLHRCKECGCGKLTVQSWDPTRSVKCPVCHLTGQHPQFK